MGIITLLVLTSTIMVSFSRPIKKSFIIVVASVLISTIAYLSSSSIIPRCAIILTFSSGIITLFCYCCLTAGYEKAPNKTPTPPLWVVISRVIVIITTREQANSPQRAKIVINTGSSMFILMAIRVLLLAMVCINKALYNPAKPLMQRY